MGVEPDDDQEAEDLLAFLKSEQQNNETEKDDDINADGSLS